MRPPVPLVSFTTISLLSLFHSLEEVRAAGFYFDTHGSFNNSCHVTGCQTCGTGQYRLGCGNSSMGTCTNCTGIANATFNTHGWFNNSCNFTCNQGYIAGPGRYCSQIIIRYTITFECTVTVPVVNNASKPFNMTNYINGVAAQAGCGGCSNVTVSPARCGSCSIGYEYTASVPVVFRRLLAVNQVNVKTSITVDDNKKLVDGAVAQINSTTLNDRLTRSGVGSASVTVAPTVTSQTIVVGPAPVPAPVPPPSPTVPPPAPTPASGDSNILPIVGGVIGGVLGLILIVVLVYVFSKGKDVDPVKPVPSAENLSGPAQGSLFTYKLAIPEQHNARLASKLVYVPR